MTDGNSNNTAIEIAASGRPLGAEIKGVDVTKVDAAQFAQIQQALYEHQVILFRDQDIDDPQLLDLARLFGKIDLPRKTGSITIRGFPNTRKSSSSRTSRTKPAMPWGRWGPARHFGIPT